VKAGELADELQRRPAVDLGVDSGGNGVRPERDGALFRRGDRGGGDGSCREDDRRRRASGPIYYESTLIGTTAPVFSQPIAIFPSRSDISAKPIVNCSIETFGVTMVMGTRTTSNFGS
jgi:hypothetical protein